MKIKKITLALFVAVLLLTVGCIKDEANDPAGLSADSLAPGKSTISLSATGAVTSTFKSMDMVSTVLKGSVLMNIAGSSVNTTTFKSEMVMIILPVNITVGTHNFSNSNPNFSIAYTNDVNGWSNDDSKQFSIVVTKATATGIEGTFSGTLVQDTDKGNKSEVTIKNGKFAAKY
jgi:hypothetical protein